MTKANRFEKSSAIGIDRFTFLISPEIDPAPWAAPDINRKVNATLETVAPSVMGARTQPALFAVSNTAWYVVYCDIKVSHLPENTLVLLKDFHQFLEEGNPVLVRKVKESLRVGKTKGRALVIVGCRLALPPEVEREFVVVQFALPDKTQLGVVLDNIAGSAKLAKPEEDAREQLLDAACGLTSIEAENAFALSVVESKQLCSGIVAREKASEVKKGGLLEICSLAASLEDIGGLEVLKAWLVQRRDAFGQEAKAYGLPSPKGLLIVGIPGTGKSLTAKATATVFNRPLLKLDAGRLFAGLVGQSESNLRSVIATVEAIAPCVLWLDELEKGFAGSAARARPTGGRPPACSALSCPGSRTEPRRCSWWRQRMM
jgi:hypothetical protein